jgi:cellulose synthase/poly-beta-1,6-N-acetylglucosamine synthase-like glycosyltransferase
MHILSEVLWRSNEWFNMLVLSYFFLGNGTYTLLMIRSLVSVWLSSQRRAYNPPEGIRTWAAAPPVTIVIPVWNEESVVVQAVNSALGMDYPHVEVVVVDDGSTDESLARLIQAFRLIKMDLSYRQQIPARQVEAFFLNPAIPNLLVVRKRNGGKADALNAGINLCRTPYFCSMDADCILERTGLLRLMLPVITSDVPVVVSGGGIRILNGCKVSSAKVVEVRMPRWGIERFQVVEYLRTFLLGRTGWHLLGGTLIVSGAFAAFHTESVLAVGGFKPDTVTEDMDLIVSLQKWGAEHCKKNRIAFTAEPVCWTEGPKTLSMLARQRRRWQQGMCQTLWKHSEMLLRPRYGVVGMLSFPFHLYVESLGAVVEALGYLLVPVALVTHAVPARVCAILVLLGVIYGTFLSVGAVLLEEVSYRRYPAFRDLLTLVIYAVMENVGYRQLVLLFRFQGVVRFLRGVKGWEKVAHIGAETVVPEETSAG